VTIERAPLSFPHAVTLISGRLGVPPMARVVRRSARLIYKWSHPEGRACPTLLQAVALDAAYVAAGGEGAPFHDTYAKLLEIEVARLTASRDALADEIAEAAREAGEAVATSMAIARPGASQRAVYRALRQAIEARTAMAVLVRRLSSFRSGSAGLPAERCGGAHDTA
jgi:hypothetical protein